jgi:hypothetical protein
MGEPWVTANVQVQLEALHAQLQPDSEISLTTTPPRSLPRFRTQLLTLMNTLLELGIARTWIERMMPALGWDVTLPSALDWFCEHVDTTELPPVLTEGAVRDAASTVHLTMSSASALTVVAPPSVSTLSAMVDTHTLPAHTSTTAASHGISVSASKMTVSQQVKDEKYHHQRFIENAQKDWLLSQYQYVSEDEEEEELDATKASKTTISSKSQPSSADTHSTTTAPTVVVINPEQAACETLLNETQTALHLLEQDLQDEAGNYMRSKHEIKDMKKRANQLRGQVQGLQRKLAKMQRSSGGPAIVESQRASLEAVTKNTANNQGAAEAEENVGLGDMFGEEVNGESYKDANGKTDETSTKPLTPDINILPYMTLEIPKDAVPSSWTGIRPKDLLLEMCRHYKWKRPTFTETGGMTRLQVLHDHVQYCGKGPHVQDYLSVVVLHQIFGASLPLHRRLPPFYRDLWHAWSHEVVQTKQQAEQVASDEMSAWLDVLIQSIPSANSTAEVESMANAAAEADDHSVDSASHAWDSDSRDDSPQPGKAHSKSSAASNRIRSRFVQTQNSPPYQNMLRLRHSLPIYDYRQDVLDEMKHHQCVIICAETGAGKTTQCPQYILEQAILDGHARETSILCTQPRRVAAISVAERVAEEMGESTTGALVGYQIRLEAVRSADTKLLFCTTGVVLRKMVDDPTLQGISHVIVDEVHERQWQIDVLLVALRNLLRGPRPDLKVLLVSIVTFFIHFVFCRCSNVFCTHAVYNRCRPRWMLHFLVDFSAIHPF